MINRTVQNLVNSTPDRIARTADHPAATASILTRDEFDRNVWCVFGLTIDSLSLSEAAQAVETSVRDGRRLSFVTPNVNWLVRACRNEEARRQILDGDLSLADGAPLVLLAKLLGVPLKGRVAGSDLFEVLRRRPGFPGRQIRVFFFGGRDGAAEHAHERLNAERGGLASVGWLNPGFGNVEAMSRPETIDTINAANPDFVVVSLGAAKGQDWIDRNRERLAAPVVAHLGAVVDFTAGSIKRAPRWISAIGLEWLFRIAAEPSLWRRYAADLARLAGLLATRLPAQMAAQPRGGEPASVKTGFDDRGRILFLNGDLNASTLSVVRGAFRDAVAARTDVVLDFAGTSRVDRAFLGLVLVLEKLLGREGKTIRATGMRRGVQALFTANMMNYAEPEALSGVSRRSVKAG